MLSVLVFQNQRYVIYPPSRLPSYPHMKSEEAELWNRFLARYGDTFEGFIYDVRLGGGNPPPTGVLPQVAEAWRALTQRRIEAVGLRADEAWLFDVEPRAGLNIVGRLRGYRILAGENFLGRPLLRLGVVTESVAGDVLRVYEAEGIDVWVV